MRTRTSIAGVLYLPVNAVLFGTGAIAVLSFPSLQEQWKYLIPAVVVASFVLAAPIAWWIAPRLRVRHWNRRRRERLAARGA
ncbi:hypothetical protein N1F89_19800 [Aquibium sp. A9E412]|uniref:hypothetical protein n=1 Tax=Aquibium sp. A9E412 TaxID=2976767 RepID=UPI0025AF100B|nr:hypothetical protein [Aquibium sp. A9E412]MDN2568475.1 hypothetical protein [Aquibium sp. A9E412]